MKMCICDVLLYSHDVLSYSLKFWVRLDSSFFLLFLYSTLCIFFDEIVHMRCIVSHLMYYFIPSSFGSDQ
jgi:hypothetical protein